MLWFVAIVVIAAVVVGIFLTGYKRGVSTGTKTPKKPETTSVTAAKVDLSRLRIPTPELVAKGKQLFLVNCASCHGPEGRGDGERAAELNPKPRNYHTEKFKFGATSPQIYKTITDGSPGTSMPAFALLPAEDRWTLVHYVRSLIPNPPPDPAEELAKSEGEIKTPTSITPTPTVAETKTGPRIPIKLAMEKLALAETPPKAPVKDLSVRQGFVLYTRHCATCHGAAGDGRVTVDLLRLNPYAYVKSRNLRNPQGAWIKDESFFARTVRTGPPSHLMPGFKNLTETEIALLYEYVKNLVNSQLKAK
ncbi:MAG: hypothetical protein A2145_05325 [candidate division Zixibacteria bacterium RBG_16_40_9]|nr:MAG: hypothetical protein A2145_05325 [candidate division Zixibacteria bacterium RBG_16_40_9]